MRTAQKIVATALILALLAAAYGIFSLGRSAMVSATKKTSDAALVDQTPFKTAQQLAQLADTPEEQELAKETLRISDYELDQSFALALQDAEAHPPALSAEAKLIQQRLQKNQRLQQALEAQVDQLTAQVAKATGARKSDLQDQLDIAEASLDVADNDVDDANRDLADAGGNQRDRIAKMKQAHEDADKSRKKPDDIFPQPVPDKPGLIHHFQVWSALNYKKRLLQRARSEADALAASLTSRHNALATQIDSEKQKSPDLAAHSRLASADSASDPGTTDSLIASITSNIAKSRSADEKKTALATTKAITLDQKNLAGLDKRVDNEKELSQDYARWMSIVSARQNAVVRKILIAFSIILLIALLGLFFNSWLDKILGKIKVDRRQLQTLRTTASVTVHLKDFIVGFLGWFVLMGKNGIRLGDWVEINGVTGEVVEIGLFHTVLLETGNWTDSSHPTGRRVTFTNSFAIEGHYFNFSTSGQWLWDELQIVVPTGQDPYPVVAAIQKKVLETTAEGAQQAEREWKVSAKSRELKSSSALPAVNIKPVIGGIEIAVRYITRANERYQLRAQLYQAAVELMGQKSPATPPVVSTSSAD